MRTFAFVAASMWLMCVAFGRREKTWENYDWMEEDYRGMSLDNCRREREHSFIQDSKLRLLLWNDDCIRTRGLQQRRPITVNIRGAVCVFWHPAQTKLTISWSHLLQSLKIFGSCLAKGCFAPERSELYDLRSLRRNL